LRSCRGSLIALRRRPFDRLEDLVVAGAPAEIAGERFGDLIPRRLRVLVEQVLCGQEESGRAVTALRSAQIGERVLERMEVSVAAGHPFDRGDLASVARRGDDEARENRLPVEEHGARAALPQLATVLGAGEAQVFA
jgi:hypothetical protein